MSRRYQTTEVGQYYCRLVSVIKNAEPRGTEGCWIYKETRPPHRILALCRLSFSLPSSIGINQSISGIVIVCTSKVFFY